MPQKPHVLDYEPVLRTGVARGPEFDFDPPEDEAAPLLPPEPVVSARPGAKDSKKKAPVTPVETPNVVIKRGHGITFIGLFLFTALVYFRPYEIFPSLKWTSSGAFWLAIGTILIFIPSQLAAEGKITIRLPQINLLFVLLFAGLLSVPLATNRLMAWYGLVEFLKVVLIFIVLVNSLRTETRLRLLINLILVVSCWMSISAFNDYRLGRFNLPGARIEGVIGGLFDNPNDMALHLVMMIPIAVALFVTSRHIVGKLIYPLCVAVMVLGIVASFSRGGFLGLIIASGYMVWRLARTKRLLFLAVALVLGAGFIALSPGDYRERIATTGDTSSVQRQNDLKRSIFVMVHHPIIGVGINNYVLFSNTDHATHNAYTQVGAELGIPAMAIYVLFLLSALKPLRRISAETKLSNPKSRYRYLAVGFEASLIGYMVASFFASVAFLWYLYYVVGYGICLARLYHANRNVELSKNGKRQAKISPRTLSTDPEPGVLIS